MYTLKKLSLENTEIGDKAAQHLAATIRNNGVSKIFYFHLCYIC